MIYVNTFFRKGNDSNYIKTKQFVNIFPPLFINLT